MVFQKPNPFPAMSIRDNVLAGLKLARIKCDDKDALVESRCVRASLWREVRDRLDAPGGALSGGQQQRLCIARSLAVQPNVLLMDEPCSALDPTSTRRIEETIAELRGDVTIVIVTHNMQQAQRVSDHCAFFLAAENEPGYVVEHGPTDQAVRRPRRPPHARLRRRPVRLMASPSAADRPGPRPASWPSLAVTAAAAMLRPTPGPSARRPGRRPPGGRPSPIKGAGSTYVGLAMQQWTAAGQAQGLDINYLPTGSPEGLDRYQRRPVDFAGTEAEFSSLLRHRRHR